jgi:hypothetical protein
MLGRSNGRCEVTGIAFDYEQRIGYFRPYAPSIDRIDPERGYTYDNCMLTCVAMNMARNEFPMHVFDRIARAYVGRHVLHSDTKLRITQNAA